MVGGVSPGQYDAGYKFGDDAKPFMIGERRPQKLNDNVGPGHYSPERADSITKTQAPRINMGMNKSPSRPDGFAIQSMTDTAGPGKYDVGYKFGDDAKPFTIGERRE